MWPSVGRKGTGVGYGHDGMAIFAPSLERQRPWLFARQHGRGFKFYDTGVSRKLVAPSGLLQESQESNVTQDVYRYLQYTKRQYYLPSDLFDEYTYESRQISSSKGYDPRISNLLSQGPLLVGSEGELSEDSACGVAFAHGRSGSELALAKLDFQTSSQGENGLENLLDVTFGTPVWLDFGSPLEQIEFADAEPSCSPYILVKYRGGTSFVGARIDNNEVCLGEKNLVTTAEYMYCAFNPWSWSQISAVDKYGTISIWDIGQGASETYKFGTFRGSSSLSPWHKIVWGDNINTCMVTSRKQVNLHDIRSESYGLEVLTQNVGQVCDISRSKHRDNEAFILTSDRVLWMDVRQPSRVMLSWEHYVHSRDPSLKMAAFAVDETSMLALYSQLVAENVVYQFQYDSGMPISADDPYSFRSPPDVVTHSLVITNIESDDVRDSRNLGILRLATDYSVTGQILSTDRFNRLERHDFNSDSSLASQSSDVDSDKDEEGFLLTPLQPPDVLIADFSGWYGRLYIACDNIVGEPEDLPDVDCIQALATRLSSSVREFFDKDLRGITTLAELGAACIASRVLYCNPAAMWNMLSQLRDHYHDTKIIVDYPPLVALFDRSDVKSISDMYDHMLTLWVNSLPRDELFQRARGRRELVIRRLNNQLFLSLGNVYIDRGAQTSDDEESNDGILDPMLKHQPNNTKGKKQSLHSTTLKLLDEWDIEALGKYSWTKFGHQRRDDQQREQTPQPSASYGYPSEFSDTPSNKGSQPPMSPSQELSSLLRSTGLDASQTARSSQSGHASSSQRLSQRAKKRRREGFV